MKPKKTVKKLAEPTPLHEHVQLILDLEVDDLIDLINKIRRMKTGEEILKVPMGLRWIGMAQDE